VRLFKRAGSECWYAQGYDADGKRWQRSTNCHDRKAAETVAKEWERRAADPRIAASYETTVRVALEAFATHVLEEARAGHRSLQTAQFYQAKCGHLLRLLGEDTLLANINARTVDGYVSARRGEGASEHTLAKELTTLRQTLELARRREVYEKDPRAVVPRILVKYEPRTRWLPYAEVQRLIAALPPDRAAQVAWMVGVGGDWSAVSRALREDVDLEALRVHVRGSKRKTRDRIVPVILERSRELLAFALANAEGAQGRLFRPWHTVNRDLVAACARAGIERCSPNDFRRTLGHWLRSAGVEPHLIAEVLGHTTSAMAERVYAKPSSATLASLVAAQVQRHAPQAAVNPSFVPSPSAAAGCSAYAADVVDSVDGLDRVDAKGETKTPQDHCGESVSLGCRRSDLNQRPWDYDSPALTS
jgi:integrase